MTSVSFYVDGSCRNQHRREEDRTMGIGIVGISGEHYQEWSLRLGAGTNQLAELLAVREALKSLRDRKRCRVTVYSDSLFVVGVLSGTRSAKAHAAEVAETLQLAAACASFAIHKVKGHSGHAQNDRANKLASQASRDLP